MRALRIAPTGERSRSAATTSFASSTRERVPSWPTPPSPESPRAWPSRKTGRGSSSLSRPAPPTKLSAMRMRRSPSETSPGSSRSVARSSRTPSSARTSVSGTRRLSLPSHQTTAPSSPRPRTVSWRGGISGAARRRGRGGSRPAARRRSPSARTVSPRRSASSTGCSSSIYVPEPCERQPPISQGARTGCSSARTARWSCRRTVTRR